MADTQNPTGLEGTQSVSALGLRWAALRGMLNSPLIMAEDQRSLRDELLRELSSIEQEFSGLPSRNPMEISAKVDIAKSALRERGQVGDLWLFDLLESVQADLQAVTARVASGATGRPPVNLTRSNQQRAEENAAATPATEAGSSSAA